MSGAWRSLLPALRTLRSQRSIVLAYHGVDTETIPERTAPPGPPRILAIGRLVEKKGHDVLIRAAALLRDRGVPFQLRIVGEGVTGGGWGW